MAEREAGVKKTLYDIPVNEDLIWDYEWKEEDYRTEKFFKWYLARVLSCGTAKEISEIDWKIIAEYLDSLVGVPERVREFWKWFLEKAGY